jgi:type II secretory pathway pseudopilin PulG
MKKLTAFLCLCALSATAQETKPADAKPADPKAAQVEVLEVEGKRFVLVRNFAAVEDFANFERNVQVINQKRQEAQQVQQLAQIALTTPEREARSKEFEAKLAVLQSDNATMAKNYGFDLSRQYLVVQTKLNVLSALSNEEYIKLAADKEFKSESVVNAGDKKFLNRGSVSGAVEVEAFKLQVQRVMETRRALQQLVDLQPRLTKDADKKKVEDAVKNAQGEVNAALEEFRKSRGYDLPGEITLQTAEAKLYTLLSDEESKRLSDQTPAKKDEEKK